LILFFCILYGCLQCLGNFGNILWNEALTEWNLPRSHVWKPSECLAETNNLFYFFYSGVFLFAFVFRFCYPCVFFNLLLIYCYDDGLSQ
jgi:hypothetical protein